MLADSGFTNVYNINGGMTALIQNNYELNTIYETKDKYSLLSPVELCKQFNTKNTFILDIRSDSAYNAISKDEKSNAIGKIKNAVHIPFSNLENSLSLIPTYKKIIIADEYGNESANAANKLAAKGYKNVAVLFDGIYNLIAGNTADINCKNELWIPNKKYHIITADDFNTLALKNKDIAILDARTSAEYNNTAKDYWRNIGRVKNSINIPANELESRFNELASFKNKPVILYHFGSSTDVFRSAAILANNGFTNVSILSGGIFNLRWRAANIKGKAVLKDWVVNIPAENL